jgi:hypothetical protein
LIEKLRVAEQNIVVGFAGFYFSLDSRLRGNDGKESKR